MSNETHYVQIKDNTNTTDAYWLRTYAGMAMQGIISCGKLSVNSGQEEQAINTVKYATALLKAIKESEGK